MAMGGTMLRTLDAAREQRLLQVNEEVLRDVHCALIKEKVCAKSKNSGPVEAREGLKDLLAWFKSEQDAIKMERMLSAILRALSKRGECVWFQDGEPARSTILWLLVCTGMGHLSQLLSGTKTFGSFSITTLAATVFDRLSEMPELPDDADDDDLDMYGFVKALVVWIVNSVPLRDKSQARKMCTVLQIEIEDVMASFTPPNATSKTKTIPVDFCCSFIASLPLTEAVQAVQSVLTRCKDAISWHRVFLDMISEYPLIAALLVDQVDTMCSSKQDIAFARFALNNFVLGLRAVENVAARSVERLVCCATSDQDSSSRVLAWKTLTATFDKMTEEDQAYTRTIACDALLMDTARSVGAAVLKLLVTDLNSVKTMNVLVSAHEKVPRVHEFLLYLMGRTCGPFPSSWCQDAVFLLARGRLGVQTELVMKSFAVATKDGKQAIASMYLQYLFYLGEEQAVCELRCLATSIREDTLVGYECFVDAVFQQTQTNHNTPTESLDFSHRIVSGCQLLMTHSDQDKALSREDLRVGILLEVGMLRISTADRSRLHALCYASTRLLRMAEISLESEDTIGFAMLEALIALRGLRIVMEASVSCHGSAVELAIKNSMVTLTSRYSLQRETVRLIYSLPQPQEKAYYCLALSQDQAFMDEKRLASFISLVGMVAYENAQYLGVLQASKNKSTASKKYEDGLDNTSSDYMEEFKESVALKNRIRMAKDDSISQGLLSAYLPLIEKSLKSHNTSIKVAAVWTLGEFMKISPTITEGFFGRLLEILKTRSNDTSVYIACLDVWYGLQPAMKPGRRKEEGIRIVSELIVSDEGDEAVVEHALKCLQTLVLDAQLRDNKMYEFAPFLVSSNKRAEGITRRFFRSYFRKNSTTKVSSTIFEVYFALASRVVTKDVAEAAAVLLMELATVGSHSLESLEVALVGELGSATRCDDALRLLAQFSIISTTTVQRLVESINRLVSSSSNCKSRRLLHQLLAKQLQRAKDKADKAAIKTALAKLRGEEEVTLSAHHRRTPLDVTIIGRHVDVLKHTQSQQ